MKPLKILLSPHDDDHALFCAFTCIRERPVVVVVTDSYVQPNRGEVGCSATERARETEASCKILGCDVVRLGLQDDTVTEEQIEEVFMKLNETDGLERVYAPMVQGGNIHHDMIGRAAMKVFGRKVVQYPTYSKQSLYEKGNIEIVPSGEEVRLKRSSLLAYESQIRINRPHFDAVVNQPEYHHRVLNKTFAITMFGSPFPWIQDFIDHVQHLEAYGWNWKIFTPADLQSKGNVEIVPMTTDQFNDLVEKKLGVRPNFYVTEAGRPSVHVTDYYVASGLIFEDYLKDADFWGITNLDVVYGRLDRFLPDAFFADCDIFTDETVSINGVFSLYRNNILINNLFKRIPNWQEKFAQQPCNKCIGVEGAETHSLYGTDEYEMTVVANEAAGKGEIRYKLLTPFPFHSHDRLEQHVPEVKLKIDAEGALWELFADTNPPQWIHARPFFGRELPYFHFCRTKEWPKSLQS